MSSISLGASPRFQSLLNNARTSRMTPEVIMSLNYAGGAAAAFVAWINPSGVRKFKVVDVRERHGVAGTLPITLKVHDNGVVAAPGAAASGTTIYPMAVITTTTAANTWQKIGSGVAWSASPGSGVNAQILGPGDTLIVDIGGTTPTGIALEIIGVWI